MLTLHNCRPRAQNHPQRLRERRSTICHSILAWGQARFVTLSALSGLLLARASSAGTSLIKVNGSPTSTFRVLLEGQESSSIPNPKDSDENQPSVEAIQE